MASDHPETLRVETDGAIRRVTLARPDVHNAFDDTVIAELQSTFESLARDAEARAVVLTGDGKSFCAGADLNWMKRVAGYDDEENLADARRLARMLATVDACPMPVIARVNGVALGGGSGLVACCDIAVASERARFAFSEVKLGIIPATISPFVYAKIGARGARRYFLTGERFDATTARDIGLVNEVVAPEALDDAVKTIVDEILTAGPGAVSAAKSLVLELATRRLPEVNEFTARLIADVRSRPEAREGMSAFLEKRPPGWVE